MSHRALQSSGKDPMFVNKGGKSRKKKEIKGNKKKKFEPGIKIILWQLWETFDTTVYTLNKSESIYLLRHSLKHHLQWVIPTCDIIVNFRVTTCLLMVVSRSSTRLINFSLLILTNTLSDSWLVIVLHAMPFRLYFVRKNNCFLIKKMMQ